MIRVRRGSHGLELELGGGGHHAGRREEDTVRRPRWGEGHGEEATMQGGHDVEDTMGRTR